MPDPASMKLSTTGSLALEGERKNINSELWHACAGPLVSLPAAGSCCVYLPQGHIEQVAASTQQDVDAGIPNYYPNLRPQLVCQLHDVILHADLETDEVYCQMTLQPVNMQERESFFVPDAVVPQSRQPNVFFCKMLTASDTSTHGGFSIPRRAAERVFPPLDFQLQPPAQEIIARDLHDTEWRFRHIYRGQPKRHLLTTGWSVFVSAKRLMAGDSILFIRNDKNNLLLGIRRANRPQTFIPSSVLSSDSMHIGVLAAAAHAASTNSRFTVFYNPRASPSEFVVPLSKFEKAVYHTRVSVGMRFRMLFETEESSVRRYMGTVTHIGDLDPVRWPNSQWRSIKVGWDESTAGDRPRRVSLWEIEPLTTFLVYPPPSSTWRSKPSWPQTNDMELESSKNSAIWGQIQHCGSGYNGLPFQSIPMSSLMSSMQQHVYNPGMHDASRATASRECFTINQLQYQRQPVQLDDMQYKAQSQPQQPLSPSLLPLQQQQLLPSSQLSPLAHTQAIQSFHPSTLSFQHPKLNDPYQQHPQQCGILPLEGQVGYPSLRQHHSFYTPVEHSTSYSQHSYQVTNEATSSAQMPPSQIMQAPNASILSTPQSSSVNYVTNVSLVASLSNSFPGTSSSVAPLISSFPSLQSNPTTLAADVKPLPSTSMSVVRSPFIPTSIIETPSIHQNANTPTPWLPSGSQSEPTNSTKLLEGMYGVPQTNGVILPNYSSAGTPFTELSSYGQDTFMNKFGKPLLYDESNVNLSYSVSTPMVSDFKACNDMEEFQNHCPNQLMQGQYPGESMDIPPNVPLLNGHLSDGHIFQHMQTLGDTNLPTRTYTKVYKSGSVGRSLDLTRFCDYNELRCELEKFFGLEGKLEDPASGWKLVFLDKENDWLLLGDGPWEVFINNVRSLKILSPKEFWSFRNEVSMHQQQPQQRSSSSDNGTGQRESHYPSSGGVVYSE